MILFLANPKLIKKLITERISETFSILDPDNISEPRKLLVLCFIGTIVAGVLSYLEVDLVFSTQHHSLLYERLPPTNPLSCSFYCICLHKPIKGLFVHSLRADTYHAQLSAFSGRPK